MGKVMRLADYSEAFLERARYGKTIEKQLNRLSAVTPNLVSALQLHELNRNQLEVFCNIAKLIDVIPDRIDGEGWTDSQSLDFYEEVRHSEDMTHTDGKYTLARIQKKRDSPLVMQRAAQLLHLIRNNH